MIDDWFSSPEKTKVRAIQNMIGSLQRRLNMLEHTIYDKGLVDIALLHMQETIVDTLYKLQNKTTDEQ